MEKTIIQTHCDNNDPEGMGRVKVDFFWGFESDWLRLIQPHSSSEIGEEVLVGFEGNNSENRYIMAMTYTEAVKTQQELEKFPKANPMNSYKNGTLIMSTHQGLWNDHR